LAGYITESQPQGDDYICLYTKSYSITLEKKHHWDNWEEFIEQVKAHFSDNDDF
jgi:hypothetical protein